MTTLHAILLVLAWTPTVLVLACILRDIQASPKDQPAGTDLHDAQ
jgi:hypothetical protein